MASCMTYAIVKINGKQYRVEEGQTFKVALLSKPLAWDLLLISDGNTSVFEEKELANADIKMSVVGESKDRKLRLGRFKSKSRYDKILGQRVQNTLVKVESIKHSAITSTDTAEKAADKPVKKTATKKATAPKTVAKKEVASKEEKVTKKAGKKLATEAK